MGVVLGCFESFWPMLGSSSLTIRVVLEDSYQRVSTLNMKINITAFPISLKTPKDTSNPMHEICQGTLAHI